MFVRNEARKKLAKRDSRKNDSLKVYEQNMTNRNSPFPSSGLPLSQNESSCKTFHMKMSLICMKMNLLVKHIFIRMVSHLDSF